MPQLLRIIKRPPQHLLPHSLRNGLERSLGDEGDACSTKWSQEGRAPHHGHHPRGHPLHEIQDYAEWEEIGEKAIATVVRSPIHGAREHHKPRYILDLLLSVINVSVQTVDIVNGLPKLEFD